MKQFESVAKLPMNDAVSLVITSCGRFDLLQTTFESFKRHNTYRNIRQLIVIDDSGYPEIATYHLNKIFKSFEKRLDLTLLVNEDNAGQVQSVDRAYSYVKHPYIFHLEDDWMFHRGGFIEHSFNVLLEYPSIITVWLRAHDDTSGHPIEFIDGLPFAMPKLNFLDRWHGFTWNPGLRRTSDYQLIENFTVTAPGESLAGQWYKQRGFRAAMCSIPEGYVRHIGWDRSTAKIEGTNKAI